MYKITVREQNWLEVSGGILEAIGDRCWSLLRGRAGKSIGIIHFFKNKRERAITDGTKKGHILLRYSPFNDILKFVREALTITPGAYATSRP
jgi:hypothetical protein